MRCPGSKWLLFFLNWKNSWKDTNFLITRAFSARHMAGWKTKNNNSSTTGSELWRNAGPNAFQCVWTQTPALQVSVLKSDKIWCAYLIVNCVSLRTLWTPLVCLCGVHVLLCFWLLSLCRVSPPRDFKFQPSVRTHVNSEIQLSFP